jgi:SAM-dependent methyltransferase
LKATLIETGPSAYDSFAPYYDAFTAASDYEIWTEQVLELAARSGWRGHTVLDLACGTGKSFLPFLRRGFDVTGCDSSSAMLAEAARKAPGAKLLHADVRDLTMVGRFDLVTCFDDSLNYLLEAHDLAAALCSVAANLAQGGLAIFDLNTLRAYRTTFARDSVSVRDETMFVWRGECSASAGPGCRAAASIDVFIPRDGGLYERVGTRHEQRHFPRELVVELLSKVRLECVGVHGVLDTGELVQHADESTQLKVLYIARHAKGGAAQ